jgi:aromatic-L-amino-acid/L-tryptophan decarboxylase
LPQEGSSPESVYADFKENILPFKNATTHPRFWAWVQGTGTPMGMMADMLASGMNPNNTIGDHAAMYVELQVIDWCKEMFGFPSEGGGLLVSGGTLANISAIIVARNHFDAQLRQTGLSGSQLVMYCSAETHNCIAKAADFVGVGIQNLRKIGVDAHYRIDLGALEAAIEADLKAGKQPFCIVGNAGTVSTGAIDPLDELLRIARKYGLWFHVDGAFGSLAKLVPEYAAQLKAIEEADSLAFDFHKWMYVNYEVGCFLIRDKQIQRNAFALTASYLTHHERGLAAGPEAFTNYGMELSRGFKALKVWMSLKEHGILKYGRLIRQNIAQAQYLAHLVKQHPELELAVEPPLNVVCFRYRPLVGMSVAQAYQLNKEILMQLHEQAIALPSYTVLNGNYVIRCAITNHRSQKHDFDDLIKGVLRIGNNIIKRS